MTRASITYIAPTRNCPTSDNGKYYFCRFYKCYFPFPIKTNEHVPAGLRWTVLVDVDLSLTFRIGPDSEDVSNFIYKLGAHRFDELLTAEVEQAIRALVYSTTHDRVNDLREEFATSMLSTLSSKFAVYGVTILNAMITNVILPPDIQNQLERTTVLQLEMAEQEKIHENRIRALEDEAARSIETIRISNRRKLQEIEEQMKRNDIERLEMEEAARSRAKLEEIKAMADADVALKKIIGDANLEKVKARQRAEAALKKSHLQCQTMQIEAETKAKIELKKSEAELAVAESKAVSIERLHCVQVFLVCLISFNRVLMMRPHPASSGGDDPQGRSSWVEWQEIINVWRRCRVASFCTCSSCVIFVRCLFK